MRRPLTLALSVLVLAATLIEARGSFEATAAPEPDSASSAGKKRGAKLRVGKSEYGRVVMNAHGEALYLFDKEQGPSSQCYGDCAAAWPPLLTRGKPRAGDGINPKLLGTTRRDDGHRQVTYRGHPLYYYVHDSPGNILCQNVSEFGGLWLLVNGRGNAIR
jgi:predicted lipoprotein with Yx(FWY)xxD motif